MGTRAWLLIALAVSGAWAAGAGAAPVTWQLQDVAFADGATAIGSFDYDAALQSASDWNIFVSGGDTATFPDVDYNATTPDHHSEVGAVFDLQIFYFEIGTGASERILALASTADLGGASGTVALEVGSFNHSYECFNCDPYRFVTSGTLVPEPSPVAGCGATGLVLGTIARARRRHGIDAIHASA